MSTTVHLLFFEGCPNVQQTRENLRKAFHQAGRKADWREVDTKSSACPPEWRGFPSPTVLVNGRDVATGDNKNDGTPACRFGGAPSSDRIAAALMKSPRFSSLIALPAVAVGLLPAAFCPACYPALAGLLGAIGLGAFAERILVPLTLGLLLIALAGLAYQGRRGGDYRPLAVGALGGTAMYAGQFLTGSSPLKFLGIALLIGASFWNVVPRTRDSRESCPDCAERR